MTAEVFKESLSDKMGSIDANLPSAIEIRAAEFTWDAPDAFEIIPGKGQKTKVKQKTKPQTPVSDEKNEEHVFKLQNVNLTVPRGQLCAIVGPVGSGKSSLLQGLSVNFSLNRHYLNELLGLAKCGEPRDP
jgi:ABC-type multidrug transport system fused ATPase/permease subunit